MSDLKQDLGFALRSFAKSPTFTAVVIVTLALGIGANTAIFGLMDQLLIRPLPVESPDRLVILDAPGPFSGSSHSDGEVLTPMSHPMYEGLRDQNEVFEGVLAHYRTPIHLTINGVTDPVPGDLVSGNFFSVLGVKPAVGRLLTEEDDVVPGGHSVVVLSESFWRRRFAGDADVVGETVLVNGEPMVVVGVTERGFHGIEVGARVDVFLPVMMQAVVIPTWDRGIGDWRARWLTVMARLGNGVSREEARAEANALYRRLLQEDVQSVRSSSESFRSRFLSKELVLRPGGRGTSALREQSRTPLIVLMTMVALVLLIACANVANLLLSRASSRGREIALRIALGASRGRVVRQLLVESVLLSIAGGSLGILVATWTGDLLLRALPSDGVSQVLSPEPDLRVGLFTFFLSLVTGLGFGLVPALQATRARIAPVLKNEASSLSTRSASSLLRRALVVTQVAISLLLLIGAGLFVRSLRNLDSVDPGFDPDGLLAFSIDPSLNGYELDRRRDVIGRIVEELASEPGVRWVSLAEVGLLSGNSASTTVSVEGYETREGEDMNPSFNGIAPAFFSTLGIPLLEGRDFDERDDARTAKVAVVNETFARYFFGRASAVGRRFAFGRGEKDVTIVGVVKDGRTASMREVPLRSVYVPYRQSPDLGEVTFYVRGAVGEVESLGGRVHSTVARADGTLPVKNLKTMTVQVKESLFVERFVATLSIVFGTIATLLAVMGIYGLLSHVISMRTRELGIRIALGAERGRLILLVLREGTLLALVGVAVGLPGGYGLGRLVESQLYGLGAWDPVSASVATFTLLGAALAAAYAPASRASRVDPMVTLRYE